MRRVQVALTVLAVAVIVGGLGAWAFNPDSGATLHSFALWETFGVVFELGLPVLFLVAIIGVAHGECRRRRSHRA
jgi:hypothetical protein